MDLKVETWPVERLVPYARNPRRNDEQVDRMCAAIREFGFRIPIVARSDGTVVDGHLRLKAAHKLGLADVPVALADELTDTQIKAFRLLANQSVNWSEWDTDLLKLELADLEAAGCDLDVIGFEPEELEALVVEEGEGGTNADGPALSGPGSLALRFGLPPFSVLDARDGWWQERKRAWLALGIKSEQGRGGGILMNAEQTAGEGLNYYRNRKRAARGTADARSLPPEEPPAGR